MGSTADFQCTSVINERIPYIFKRHSMPHCNRKKLPDSFGAGEFNMNGERELNPQNSFTGLKMVHM